MNLALSREIYGLNPWCVDQTSFPALMSILDNIRNGSPLEIPEQKYNSISFYDFKSKETRVIDRPFGNGWSPGQLENRGDFNGIGIISLDGVITVSGGASSHGMEHLSTQMQLMAEDDRVKSFIVLGNSGGGSSMAVEIMTETIKAVDKIKPVFGLVKKGGMMASAAFGIMSACRNLWAESEMSIVGSAGTMMQFEGREANTKNKDGVKFIRLYAPESTDKNKGFEDSLNKDNYTFIIDSLLKPMNDRFLSLIESNRPQLKGTSFRNGHTVHAKDAIGTFIDGIKSFAEVIEIASKNIETNSNFNTNINSKTMTKAEIKAAHPSAYAEIVAEGVSSEKDRAGAWMAHNEADPGAVKSGIESGKEISATQREAFFVKQNTKNTLKTIEAESTEAIVAVESEGAKKIINKEQNAELEAAFDFELN